METPNNVICPMPEEEKVLVVEMTNTFNIGGEWLKHKHQYYYVRSELRECEERFIIGFKSCIHHIIFYKDKEIAVPEHIGILTDVIKSELEQDTLMYFREKYSDGIKHRWEFYKKYLPIDPSDDHRENAQHAWENYREYVEQKYGK